MALAIFLLRDISYKFLQNKSIFILLPIGCGVYIAMLFLTRTITKEMIDLIRKPRPATAPIEPDENLEL
jgi:hypothetical protein